MADFTYHLATSLITGVVSALLTWTLAWRRFRTEKWRERRADAYERIIDALHSAKRFSDVHLERWSSGGNEPADEELKELREQSKNGHDYVLRAVDTGRFILPDEALYRLNEYSKEYASNRGEDFHSYLANGYDIANRCLVDLAKIARKDLRVDRLDSLWSDINWPTKP
jgi:hypothetical protein